MAVNLTARQPLVLDFMQQFFAENDQPPPATAVAEHFGFKSLNSAYDHIKALERKGFIERNAVGNFRFVRERELAATQEQK